MDGLFQVIPYLFFGMFFLTFGMVIYTVIKSVGQWNKNNRSPKLTVDATAVAKRTEFFRRRSAGTRIRHTVTMYYVTFQVESGDRFELSVDGAEFGLIVEGDRGKLTFQGTRFLGFDRA